MLKDPMTLDQALRTERFKAYAGAFRDAGYDDWKSLGGSPEDVKTALAPLLTQKPDAALMAGLWQEWHDAGARNGGEKAPDTGTKTAPTTKQQPKPLDMPDLPAGMTFALAAASVTLDDVTYTIPRELATEVDSRPVTLASDLTALEWLVIARSLFMLKCLVGDRLFDSSKDPRASEAALDWRVPEMAEFAEVTDNSLTKTTLLYSHHAASLSNQRIEEVSVGLASPFAAGALKASRDETVAKASVRKTLRLTGTKRYQRATLYLDKCTELSPAFVAALDDALGRPAPERFAALKRVFENYGTAYPKQIVLGGLLYFYHEETATGTVIEQAVKETIATVVKAKYANEAASATGQFGTGEKTTRSAQDIYQETELRVIGGDTAGAGDWLTWDGTVKSPRLWRIIERGDMAPLVDRLDAARKKAVGELWESGRSIAWDGLRLPEEQAFPDMEGKPFLLNNVGVDGPLSRRSRELAPSAFLSDWHSLAVGKRAQLVGQGHDYRWRLVYSGYTSGDGLRGFPFYYLAVDDGSYEPPAVEISVTGREQIRLWRGMMESPGRNIRALGVNNTTKGNDPHVRLVNIYSSPMLSQPRSVTPLASLWWSLIPANPDRTSGSPAEFYVQNLAKQYLVAGRWEAGDDVGGLAVARTDTPPDNPDQAFWRWRPVSI